mmetsp:Transcript_9759/g.23082  ORF Transcript_9759/g.23082 Transcript_9759/m.23082 type:complete len:231 (+) Transcript_9759:235-927(+)
MSADLLPRRQALLAAHLCLAVGPALLALRVLPLAPALQLLVLGLELSHEALARGQPPLPLGQLLVRLGLLPLPLLQAALPGPEPRLALRVLFGSTCREGAFTGNDLFFTLPQQPLPARQLLPQLQQLPVGLAVRRLPLAHGPLARGELHLLLALRRLAAARGLAARGGSTHLRRQSDPLLLQFQGCLSVVGFTFTGKRLAVSQCLHPVGIMARLCSKPRTLLLQTGFGVL